MKVSTQILICLGCLMAGALPGQARAQEDIPEAMVPHEQILSANPFLLLWEWANVEYERKVSPTGSVGIAGSTVSFDDGDANYKSLNGFYRYYPSGALEGFYLGGRLGIHQGSEDDDDGHVYGFGIDIGYAWLLGDNDNFYIGLGIGATRFFGGDLDTDERVVLPSIRLVNIGVAF